MTGEEALVRYGFVKGEDGVFRRGATDRWEKGEGGWFCFQRPSGPIEVIEGEATLPWGREIVEGPMRGLILTPFRVSDQFEGVGGLHPALHPDCFEWVWPDEKVAEIYTYAPMESQDGTNENKWVRQDDGSLKRVEDD